MVKRVDKEAKKVRDLLRDIGAVSEFERILSGTMLSEEEKRILTLHYKEGKQFTYIADELGLSEWSVKHKHRKILMKIGKAVGKM